MDPTGCPPGLATDFIFQRTSLPCASSIEAYWGVTMGIWFVKAICAGNKVRVWSLRKKRQSTRMHRDYARRLPVPQIASCSAVLIYLVMFILCGLNIATVHNGIPFSLFSLAFIPAMLEYVLVLLKLVRLGKKIIPLAMRVVDLAVVERFDAFGLTMLFIQAFSLTGSCLALIILSPIIPEEDYTLGMLGWAFKCTFLGFAALSLFYQYQRVINALLRFNDNVATSSSSVEVKSVLSKNLSAIKVLRKRQFSPNFILLVETTILLGLLAGSAVPWTWEYIFGGVVGSEVAGTFIYEFIISRPHKKPVNRNMMVVLDAQGNECANPKMADFGEAIVKEEPLESPDPLSVDVAASPVIGTRCTSPVTPVSSMT